MQSRAVKIVEGGKLIIPASFRREMEIGIGDTVVVELVDGELRVRSRKADLRRLQRRVRQIGKREGAEQSPAADEASDLDAVEIANG
jgi:bifunctional DNA-binding transcriptional regulator/antitoxin component of YhaV-PrlF toxin-antitoxin module